jgi:hypothetical protein
MWNYGAWQARRLPRGTLGMHALAWLQFAQRKPKSKMKASGLGAQGSGLGRVGDKVVQPARVSGTMIRVAQKSTWTPEALVALQSQSRIRSHTQTQRTSALLPCTAGIAWPQLLPLP